MKILKQIMGGIVALGVLSSFALNVNAVELSNNLFVNVDNVFEDYAPIATRYDKGGFSTDVLKIVSDKDGGVKVDYIDNALDTNYNDLFRFDPINQRIRTKDNLCLEAVYNNSSKLVSIELEDINLKMAECSIMASSQNLYLHDGQIAIPTAMLIGSGLEGFGDNSQNKLCLQVGDSIDKLFFGLCQKSQSQWVLGFDNKGMVDYYQSFNSLGGYMLDINQLPNDLGNNIALDTRQDEVIWRNTQTGEVHIWKISEGEKVDTLVYPNLIDGNWNMIGGINANSDGFIDILWESRSGKMHAWPSKNAKGELIDNDSIRLVDYSFDFEKEFNVYVGQRTVCTANFDTDGNSELLSISNTENTSMIVDLDDQGEIFNVYEEVIPEFINTTQILGCGDMDGDGVSDILTRDNLTGDIYANYINPATYKVDQNVKITNSSHDFGGFVSFKGEAHLAFHKKSISYDSSFVKTEFLADLIGQTDAIYDTTQIRIYDMKGNGNSFVVGDQNEIIESVSNYSGTFRDEIFMRNEDTGLTRIVTMDLISLCTKDGDLFEANAVKKMDLDTVPIESGWSIYNN